MNHLLKRSRVLVKGYERTQTSLTTLVMLNTKNGYATHRVAVAICMIWCGREDLNLHELAPTRT